MGEFLTLVSCDEADLILERFEPVSREEVPLVEAPQRVLAKDITAPIQHPAWPRARMDGYAVTAQDTFGATESLPAMLNLIGTVRMGEDASALRFERPGDAAGISTGGMLPPSADAVLMLEYASEVGANTIEVYRPVAIGENVLMPGEDVKKGRLLLQQGSSLGAAEIAVLATFGVDAVPVYRRPRVLVLSTGDELVAPGREPAPGQIRDCNTYATLAQVQSAGAQAIAGQRVADDAEALKAAIQGGLEAGHDLVLVSGGSSVGVRDLTAAVLEELGEPGILVHGINIRPGKPTIVADIGGVPVIGLPGYPVSSMMIVERFIRPLIHRLAGRWPIPKPFFRRTRAKIANHLHSRDGREDYVRVCLEGGENGATLPVARPLLGGSAALSSLLNADGLVRVDAGCEGLAEGTEVEVLGFSNE